MTDQGNIVGLPYEHRRFIVIGPPLPPTSSVSRILTLGIKPPALPQAETMGRTWLNSWIL
jgi:hypothetical protein